MKEHAKVQHFQQTLDGKDCGKAIVKISQLLVDFRVFFDRIFQSQGDTAQQDDKHDEPIKEWSSDEPMKSNSHSAKIRNVKIFSIYRKFTHGLVDDNMKKEE